MCDSCEAITINGVACHEAGCPDSWKHPWTGEPYTIECDWCGQLFVPQELGQWCCGNDCAAAYYGQEEAGVEPYPQAESEVQS